MEELLDIPTYFKNESQETIDWLIEWRKHVLRNRPFHGWASLGTLKRIKYHNLALDYCNYMNDFAEAQERIDVSIGGPASDNN